MQPSPNVPAPPKSVAQLQAERAALDAEIAAAEAEAHPAAGPLSLETLDARVTDIERRLNGGAAE